MSLGSTARTIPVVAVGPGFRGVILGRFGGICSAPGGFCPGFLGFVLGCPGLKAGGIQRFAGIWRTL